MGIFGNISETIGSLSQAFKHLIYRPFDRNENTAKAFVVGSLVFCKDAVGALSGSVGSVAASLKQGAVFLVNYAIVGDEQQELGDKDLFDDDIEQANSSINSSPLTMIDT